MRTLIEMLQETAQKQVAVGHFNFAETTVLTAAAAAARELGVPVIVGTSESERAFMGPEQTAALVRSYREQGVSIFLNADHTKSLEKVKEAVAAGYDAILFDGSDWPLEENTRRTKEAVAYVKSVNPEILVEGEIGYIGSGSQLREEVPEGVQLTTPEEAARFVEETGVDLLAPAVGNVHGLVKGGEPKLDIERIRAIKTAVKVPLVLHGASGNSDEDVKAAIKAGISIVHISTEIRLAWRTALEEFLKTNPQELAPYKILEPALEVARQTLLTKLRLFKS